MKLPESVVISECWERGLLSYKLYDYQKPVYKAVRASGSLDYLLNICRRFGKSTIGALLTLEEAVKNSGWNMGLIAPTQKAIRNIIYPIMEMLLKDCPRKMYPEYRPNDAEYRFPNGSKIFLAGTDQKRYEKLRGLNLHGCVVDEAGFCEDLEYIVSDILQPATMTTGGHILLQSTPPKSPSHDFYYMAAQAESDGNYMKKTLDDIDILSDRVKDKYIKAAGGMNSTTCRREYYCQFVTDEESAIFPEFTDEVRKDIEVEWKRPDRFDLYGAMDPGFSDHTAYLLGYYDFLSTTYVVEGELWLNKAATPTIADGIRKLETSLFLGKKIYLRVSDTDLQILHDMAVLHDLYFSTTLKDNKEAQINFVRTLIGSKKIKIHPRCVNLIRQIRTGIWNDNKTSYLRTKAEGHFDLLDALVYLIRNIDVHKNPYPTLPDYVTSEEYHVNPQKREKDKIAVSILGLDRWSSN